MGLKEHLADPAVNRGRRTDTKCMICRHSGMKADVDTWAEEHKANRLHWAPQKLWGWLRQEHGVDVVPKSHDTLRAHIRGCLGYAYENRDDDGKE